MQDAIILLSLPIDTLTMLVAGYLGYRLAYIGKDENLQAVDVVFRSLVFGLIARAMMALAGAMEWPQWCGITAGLVMALLAAAGWRRWGQELTFRALRKAKVSMADGHNTALKSVVKRESIEVRQIIVQRSNGTDLMCDNTKDFEDTATGPHWFGEDGSVALYVTHIRRADEWEEVENLRDPFGDMITVVPADDVALIKLRTK